MKQFLVSEIFGPTIQGEGATIGLPTVFLRMAGCDYKCKFCDTWYAVDKDLVKENSIKLTAPEIVHNLKVLMRGTGVKLVTISGGNPLMWDLDEVVEGIKQDHPHNLIAVETQASVYRPWITKCDIITLSPKGPGMVDKPNLTEFEFFVNCLIRDLKGSNVQMVTVKIPVFGVSDLDFAEAVSELLVAKELPPTVYLSVGNFWASGSPDEVSLSASETREEVLLRQYRELIAEVLHNRPKLVSAGCSILPQIHVLLYGNQRGY